MTTFTPAHTTETNSRQPVRPASRECRHAASEDQCRKWEANQKFEAAIERFLAVSRAA